MAGISRVSAARLGVAGLVALTLVACGGGGGGAGSQPAQNVAVTAANQDDVTRASFAGMATGTLGGSLGIAGGGQSSPLSLAAPAVRRALVSTFKRTAAAGRKLPATVYPDSGACTVSGSYSGSVNDRDENRALSVGDTVSVTFSDCVEEAGVVMNGKMSFTYTQISQSPVTVGASVSAEGLSVRETATSYVASMNGGFNFTYSEPTASTGVTRMVVPDALEIGAQTPAFSDTVTLLDGYTVDSTYDTTAPARTVSTATGPVASQRAGGFVRVSTAVPLVQYDTEDYPHSGQIIATGLTGKLRATVQSNTTVQIELDAAGDGTYETSKTVTWISLL